MGYGYYYNYYSFIIIIINIEDKRKEFVIDAHIDYHTSTIFL